MPQVDARYSIRPSRGVEVVIRDPRTQRVKPKAIIDATGDNAHAIFDGSGLQRQGEAITHNESREAMWFVKVPGRELSEQHVTVDLGRMYELTDIEVWNFNRPNHRHGGIKMLEVSGGIDPSGLDEEPRAIRLQPAPDAGPCLAEHHPLDLRARYVRLRPTNAHGSGLGFGLSEVVLYGQPVSR